MSDCLHDVGNTLWRRYRTAIQDRNRQREAHQGLTSSLPQDLVSQWETICQIWERAAYPKEKAADGSKLVNPFSVKRECEYAGLCLQNAEYSLLFSTVMTQAQVEVELAMEDEMMEQKGIPLRNRTRPGKFILMGLELEESQCVDRRSIFDSN